MIGGGGEKLKKVPDFCLCWYPSKKLANAMFCLAKRNVHFTSWDGFNNCLLTFSMYGSRHFLLNIFRN